MIERVRRWRWPAVIILFGFCVLLKLNGSSVAFWSKVLHEPETQTGLLLSTPKMVRLDEWHGWTPSALSQARQKPPFPIENPNLGGGRAPLLMSVPVAYYTTFFRPQLWGFFLFGFERGYSFYWCCKVFGLLLASGWFLGQLGLRNRCLVLFGTLWIFFSGYVQWWFSSPAMLPEMLATWAIGTGCAIKFFKETSPWRIALAFAVFVFCVINFVLCLYPPYQISLLFLAIAIIVGAWFENWRTGHRYWTKRGILLTGISITVVILALVPFWIDARSTLDLIAHTNYPGARRTMGGGLSLFQLFSGVVGFFQTEETIPTAYDNICEASNFYPLWPAAILAVLVARWRRVSVVSPLISALGIVIICLSLYCVAPFPSWLVRATFLGFTTERRTLLTIGLANILLCCVFLDRYRSQIFTKRGAASAGLVFWFAIAVLLWNASLHNRGFFPDWRQVALALIVNAAVATLFFWEVKRPWLPAILAVFLIISNAGVNPIMRGLSPLLNADAFKAIDKIRVADPEAKWIAYNDFNLAQLILATGARVLNGNKIVPDFTFWHRLDPSGRATWIYNRYANIVCRIPADFDPGGLSLFQEDVYILSLPPDSSVLKDFGCRYLVLPEVWPDAEQHGFSLARQITPSKIWIYQRQEGELLR
jgi:hypothetical protein